MIQPTVWVDVNAAIAAAAPRAAARRKSAIRPVALIANASELGSAI